MLTREKVSTWIKLTMSTNAYLSTKCSLNPFTRKGSIIGRDSTGEEILSMSVQDHDRITTTKSLFLLISKKQWDFHFNSFRKVVCEYYPFFRDTDEFHLHLLELPLENEVGRNTLSILLEKAVPCLMRIEHRDTVHNTFNEYFEKVSNPSPAKKGK